MTAAKKKTFKTTIVREGNMCFIPLPFDPKPVFGKTRAPVRVTLNGFSYRSTVASMGDGPFLPLRRSHREAAGLEGGETLNVTLELDVEARVVEPPRDLTAALKTAKMWERWSTLSYTHQREYAQAVEGAVKPETRQRRIDKTITDLRARAAPAARKGPSRVKPTAAVKASSRMNTAWHARNPMPRHASLEQRLTWHKAHAARCGCRPMPVKLRALSRA